MRSRVRISRFREPWCLACIGVLAACAQSESASQPVPDCLPPAELGGALSREPSPLLIPDEGGSCRIDEQGRLSRACVPRCSTAVRAPFYACRDPGCEESALGSDLTAPVNALDSAGTRALDCVACIRLARTFCLHQACPTEAAGRDACLARGDGSSCAAESTALNGCFLNHQHLYEPCWFLAVETCFSGK